MGSAGGSPSAWNAAHSTAQSKIHQTGAPSRRASPPRSSDDGVAHRAADHRGRGAHAAERGHVGGGGAAAEDQPGGDRGGGGGRGGAGDERVAGVAARAQGHGGAGERDAGQEHAVEEGEEGQQHVAAAAGAEPGLGDGPQRHGGAAGPGRGEQPGGGGAAERDLRARTQAQARGRPAADEPEERDVAAEGEELGDRRERDPGGVGGGHAVQHVGEHAEPASGEEEHRDGRRREREGERRAPGDHAEVEGGEGELGSRV